MRGCSRLTGALLVLAFGPGCDLPPPKTEAAPRARARAEAPSDEDVRRPETKAPTKPPGPPPGAADMPAIAKELRAFVAELKARPDVKVTHADLGGPADKAHLAAVERDHPELAAFYREMDGLHLEWHFVKAEHEIGGRINIPPARRWTGYDGEDEAHMGWADDEEAAFLDEVSEGSASTWLVRTKKGASDRPVRVVTAGAGEGEDGTVSARTIAEYLRIGMARGFVEHWPELRRANPTLNWDLQEAALDRFEAGRKT